MRNAVGIFGLICGSIVVGLVARYGYRTTDVEVDAWIMAFLFGVIAAAGLAGHAVAMRLWPINRWAAGGMGIVSAVALVLNLSNSLGAIAGRHDTETTRRIDKNRAIRTAEAELKRLTRLRDEMPAFVHTDYDTVSAAKRSVDAATTAKERECGNGDPKQRGRDCKAREADEKIAVEKFAAASAAKAATDRATKLEGAGTSERAKLAELGPSVIVNTQGSALARLFRLPDAEAEFAATVQQFGTAAIVELIIAMCLIAWEVLDRHSRQNGLVEVRTDPVAEPAHSGQTPAQVAPPAEKPSVPDRPKPKLAVVTKQPMGAVLDFLHDGLEIVAGPRLEMVDAFLGYSSWCKQRDLRAMGVAEFVDEMEKLCEQFGIRVVSEADSHYLIDVRLAFVSMPAGAPAEKE